MTDIAVSRVPLVELARGVGQAVITAACVVVLLALALELYREYLRRQL